MINHIETINQILDKEKKISKEDTENMKMYFQERINKDFIEDEDLALNFMKIALNYIKNLELENEDLKNLANKTQWISPCYVAQNYIAISVIQNKIDEYREKRNKLADAHFWDNERNINEDTSLFIAIETLKLLLEERNKSNE